MQEGRNRAFRKYDITHFGNEVGPGVVQSSDQQACVSQECQTTKTIKISSVALSHSTLKTGSNGYGFLDSKLVYISGDSLRPCSHCTGSIIGAPRKPYQIDLLLTFDPWHNSCDDYELECSDSKSDTFYIG